uniref:Uncharacterized protein n=1 Tax=Rhizophora mucronata TaxID=61149 RepID=A0A2P2N057_RHIMU
MHSKTNHSVHYPISRPHQITIHHNVKNHTKRKLRTLKVWLHLNPSKKPQSNFGFFTNHIQNSNKQFRVRNHRTKLVRHPISIAKSPGLFLNSVKDDVFVMRFRCRVKIVAGIDTSGEGKEKTNLER